MCVSIIDGENEIETLGKLKEWVGTQAVVYHSVGDHLKPDYGDEMCLCGVDINATMKAARIDIQWPDHRMYCEVIRR